MKRAGYLFDQATSHAALYDGYLDARKNKRSTRAVYAFERRLGAELAALHEELRSGTYRPRAYNHFWIYEPKPRQISAPAFRDRVVQHALYRAVQPIVDRSFIDQSFACRPGKGTHAAADYIQRALQQVPRDSYFLQLDIRRYYYRIDRDILRGLIERKIKDRRAVDLWMLFADSGEPLGLPIGCLMSQLDGLIYLNPLDHFIKRDLGVKHYARYVDDFVLVGLTRTEALDYREQIIEFLRDRLHLELSKSTVARVTRGINFVGYRTWASRRYVRKHALYTYRHAAKRRRVESLVSSLGHARKTASLRHMLTHLKDAHHALYRQLPQSLHALHHDRTAPARCGRH